MRCSICDRNDTRYIYNNWHCGTCEDVIRQTIGDIREEDIIEMFEDSFELSMDTSDYSSLEDTED